MTFGYKEVGSTVRGLRINSALFCNEYASVGKKEMYRPASSWVSVTSLSLRKSTP